VVELVHVAVWLIVLIAYVYVFDQASGENASRVSSGRLRQAPDDVQHIGRYRLIKTIGRGNFAKVKLAKHIPTGRLVNH